jgi:PAS domain S-box-containing protein
MKNSAKPDRTHREHNYRNGMSNQPTARNSGDQLLEEVTRKQEQLSLVLQAAGAAVWEMDKERHRELVAVRMHESMFGALPADRKKSWEWWVERIHPDERASVLSSLQQALNGEADRWEQEYRFCMVTDTYHWISDIAHITRDTHGAWQRITGAMIDINARRTAAILSQTGDALIVLDAAGNVAEFNAIAEQMFGYTASEVTDKSALQLVAERQRDGYSKVMRSDQPFRAIKLALRAQQLWAQRKDGTLFPADIKLSPVAALSMVVCVVRDLSEVVKVQQEVGKIASWEQESIGRELHDNLGQRLTGLRMLAMHLRHRCSPSEPLQARILEDIIAQLKDAAIEISRISRGLAPISVAPEGLADALATLMERVNGSGNVQCNFRTVPGINIVDHDVAHQLYRIAQEAVNNALKYAGARNITVSLANNGDQLDLCVKDDGAGFEIDEIITRGGLGLRIMRYRANTIGAQIRIESAPGKGTRITCTFPTSAFA